MKINNKLSSDLILNYISVGITALCGAAFSIIISVFYPEQVLGRFNTVYSYYIVLSQVCVCGIHMAIVKYTADEAGKSLRLLFKALMVTAIISISVSALFGIINNLVLLPFIGESFVRSFNTILVALVFFSINKVFLGWLNGEMRMKAYAFFQASRNVIIAISLIGFSLYSLDGEKLTLCFFVSEILITVMAIVYMIIIRKQLHMAATKISAKDLIWFGIRILPSNAIVELNTKIDVISLSILLHDEKLIGIYSFAAMFAEGFYQLLVVLRKIINPHITIENIKGNLEKYLKSLQQKYLKQTYFFSFLAYILLIGAYNLLVLVIGKNSYFEGAVVLAIVSLCAVCNTKMIVLGNILSQIGYPEKESLVNIFAAGANACLNILFIKMFGMIGAALATGFSYFIFSVLLKYYFKQVFIRGEI